jgi:hypothetical protein
MCGQGRRERGTQDYDHVATHDEGRCCPDGKSGKQFVSTLHTAMIYTPYQAVLIMLLCPC